MFSQHEGDFNDIILQYQKTCSLLQNGDCSAISRDFWSRLTHTLETMSAKTSRKGIMAYSVFLNCCVDGMLVSCVRFLCDTLYGKLLEYEKDAGDSSKWR